MCRAARPFFSACSRDWDAMAARRASAWSFILIRACVDHPAARGVRPGAILRPLAPRAASGAGSCGGFVACARVSSQSARAAHRTVPRIRAIRPHAQSHEPHAPQARSLVSLGGAWATFRSGKNVRRIESTILRGTVAKASYRMEYAVLVAAVRLL